MKVTLLAPTPPDISAFGTRSLSSCLKEKGHDVRVVFLPGGIDLLSTEGNFAYRYSDSIVRQTVDICRDADLVGISFMTLYYDRARQLAEAVRAGVEAPLVVGGIHPSVRPVECLDFADYAAVGEAEGTVAEMLERMRNGRDMSDVQGIYFAGNGGNPVANPIRPLEENLDQLPDFDFGLDGHYIYDLRVDRIVPMTEELMKMTLPKMPSKDGRIVTVYRTMTARGCPHRCSYCSNRAMGKLYANQSYLRQRSVERVIRELENVTNAYPFIEGVQFFDDTFFAIPMRMMRVFAEEYKARIGVPFYAQCSPRTLSEEKLDLLIDAGLVFLEMGVQSGSPETLRMYDRYIPNERVIKAAEIIHNRRDALIPPNYHFILDNPWESDADRLQTLDLLLQLPQPFGLCLSSLIFFPKTELHRRAVEDKLIHDDKSQVYRKAFYVPQSTWLNLLISWTEISWIPRGLLRLLAKKTIIEKMNSKRMNLVRRFSRWTVMKLQVVEKGIQALAAGDFQRILCYLRKIR